MVGSNQRYGLLTTLSILRRTGGRNWWHCCCDCGNYIVIRQDSLLRNKHHSCGCAHPSHIKVHGERNTRTYWTWIAMRRRCRDKKYVSYRFYGARGISVCREWNDPRTGYQKFVDDMGQRPVGMTLDRKDVDGNYEPNNCRWSTADVQSTNKRFYANLAREGAEYDYWSQQEEEYLKAVVDVVDVVDESEQ